MDVKIILHSSVVKSFLQILWRSERSS